MKRENVWGMLRRCGERKSKISSFGEKFKDWLMYKQLWTFFFLAHFLRLVYWLPSQVALLSTVETFGEAGEMCLGPYSWYRHPWSYRVSVLWCWNREYRFQSTDDHILPFLSTTDFFLRETDSCYMVIITN